jgi:hypothetical protein
MKEVAAATGAGGQVLAQFVIHAPGKGIGLLQLFRGPCGRTDLH